MIDDARRLLRSKSEAIAAATPKDRNRYADLLRVVAIAAVVVGHWLAIDVRVRAGRLTGQNVLGTAAWTHPFTWLFQVIPIFFLVGGYANSLSWASHSDRGGDWASWWCRRAARLLRPTTVFVAAGAVLTQLARLAGVAPQLVDEAAWMVAIPLWFLAAYVAVVALTPVMYAAHRRWGMQVPATMTVTVGLVDAARLAFGVPLVGYLNFGLVWLAIHQLGFCWRDGRLAPSTGAQAVLASIGLLALMALTILGPYPVSMVGVPGAELQNTSPPTIAILALAAFQVGVALLLRERAARWLERPEMWAVVVALNRVILTVFLWHLVPVVIAGAALYQTGLMPQPNTGSAAWLALRPVWVATLGILLASLVAALARFEAARRGPRRGERIQGRLRKTLPLLSVPVLCVGLSMFTLEGFYGTGPWRLPAAALTFYLTGVALLRACRR